MIDLYVMAASSAALESVCASCANVIGPLKGREAVPAQTLEDGSTVPEQSACGDPAFFYACLRTAFAPALPEGVSSCPVETGLLVLGKWA